MSLDMKQYTVHIAVRNSTIIFAHFIQMDFSFWVVCAKSTIDSYVCDMRETTRMRERERFAHLKEQVIDHGEQAGLAAGTRLLDRGRLGARNLHWDLEDALAVF